MAFHLQHQLERVELANHTYFQVSSVYHGCSQDSSYGTAY